MLNQTALAGTLDFVSLASQFENGIAPSRAKAYVCREEPTMTAAPLMQHVLASIRLNCIISTLTQSTWLRG